jgi:S-adenosyl-L-methionine hydrolase (adenosine-forming)
MTIVTLTTDWKSNDYYVGAIKGRILSQCPKIQVVDISHQVQSFNITQAAFIIRNCFYNFPKGSIHIIGVNSEAGEDTSFLIIEYNKHFFIGTDNGMFGLMFSEEPSKIISIKSPPEIKSFSSFSVFADAACNIANGEKPESLGKVIKEFQKRVPIRAAIDKSVITGTVIYIDSFRNAITNITRDLFDRVGKDRPFEIFVQSNHYKLTQINTYYHETTPGEILTLFNSVGLLEIAINKGNAADLLNLSTNSTIRVKFKDDDKKKAGTTK